MLVKIPDQILADVWKKAPLSIRKHVIPRHWLMGGAIRDLIIGEVPVDWDIFKTGLMGARQPIKTYDELVIDLVTLSIPVLERFKEFDYRCCMLGIGRTPSGKLVSVMDPLAYDDCIQKRLVLNPRCVYYKKLVERMKKFIKRGWKIDEENRQKVQAVYEYEVTTEPDYWQPPLRDSLLHSVGHLRQAHGIIMTNMLTNRSDALYYER
jgi:hypothetical protein